jgi:hypothetical protein
LVGVKKMKKFKSREEIVKEINRIAADRLKIFDRGEDSMSSEDWRREREMQGEMDELVDFLNGLDAIHG